MKVDKEQEFCHGTVGHKPDSKHFESDNDNVGCVVLNLGNELVKENLNSILSDLKGREGDAKGFTHGLKDTNGWNDSKLGSDKGVDSLMDDDEKKVRDFVAPTPSSQTSPGMQPFEKDSVFFLDKSVVERELPQLIVCYKENSYHVVKDICIDEGVPTKDKFLFDTGIDEKSSSRFQSSAKDVTDEMVKEKVDLDFTCPDVVKSSAEKEKMDLHLPFQDLMKNRDDKGSEIGSVRGSDSEDFMLTGEVKENAMVEIANDASKDIFSLGDLLSLAKLSSEIHFEPSNKSMNEAEQQSLQRPGGNAIMEKASICQDSENGGDEAVLSGSKIYTVDEESDVAQRKAIPLSSFLNSDACSASENSDHGHEVVLLASPALISAAEEGETDSKESRPSNNTLISAFEEPSKRIVDELSFDRNVETGSITFNFDSSAAEVSGTIEGSKSGGSENLGVQDPSKLEDSNKEPVSSQLQYCNGETSFSAAGPVSGLISYSGPIAYSGSLSLRSDSSTTSTRSFAFPILQSEWNSSPVRMAKADRRHFRKHRGWRQGLLCCRF